MERSNQIGWAQVRAGVFIFVALIFGLIYIRTQSRLDPA